MLITLSRVKFKGNCSRESRVPPLHPSAPHLAPLLSTLLSFFFCSFFFVPLHQINDSRCCCVSTGILSQRMFVMLPCGGVGVRESSHTRLCNAPQSPRGGRVIERISASDESQYCFKDKPTGPGRSAQRQDIKEEKRVRSRAPRSPDSPSETMTIALI